VLADIRGPAAITHIWMTQRNHYRECLLRITWNNAPQASGPSVISSASGTGRQHVSVAAVQRLDPR
jgi:hypothetical protein